MRTFKFFLCSVFLFSSLPTQAQFVQFGFFRKTTPASINCPTNYLLVPKLTGYSTSDFCVAKYEAKQSGSTAVSQAAGAPWVSVSRDNAISYCQNNGSGYNLISNAQWQAVARNIEGQAANWSGGTVYYSYLNYGNSTGGNGLLAANTSDNYPCDGTGQTCSSTTWNQLRRTHVLSTGQWIWDLAGNAEEWVRDDATFASSSHYLAFATGADKDTYGPAADYSALPAANSPYGLLGVMTAVTVGNSLIRGGNSADGGNSGIFRLYSTSGTGGYSSRGFRCVYAP